MVAADASISVSLPTRTGKRVYPYGSYRFRVIISGLSVGEFSECSGLEMTVKTDEVREGGENRYVHRLPGRIEYGNLTLRRGYAVTNEFFSWFQTSFTPVMTARKTVTIALVNQDGATVMEWTFLNAYPVKWTGPSFKAGDNAIAVESLELAHSGLLLSRV
jgi:phage tail-like protein